MARWTCLTFVAISISQLLSVTVASASDGDRPLIWSVSRSGQHGVMVRTGVQLRTSYAPKVGIDTSLIPTKSGEVDANTMPIKLWARIRLEGFDVGPGNPVIVNADVNPVRGSAGVSLEANRSWTVSPDVELASTSVLRASRVHGEGDGLSATQRINLSVPDWSTSIYSETVVDSVDNQTTGSVGVNKSIFKSVNLSASLANVFGAPKPQFHAGYRHRW
jgi:hypothetical protein